MTKAQLRAYRDIKRERNQLRDKINELEAELYSPGTQRLDGQPRGGSGHSDERRDGQIDKKNELYALYREKEAQLAAAALEIEEAIDSLGPRERTLMRLYYIDGLTWEEVAVKMGYVWRHVHRIHGEALEALRTKETT